MKKLKITALILAMLMLAASLASCKDSKGDDTDTDTDAKTEDTSADNGGENGGDKEETAAITVADAKATDGVVGDVKAAFAAEDGAENVITAPEQNAVNYALYASFSHPTVVKSLVITAPSADQSKMGGASIDGSVDGVNWVTLKTLGSTIVKNKVYTLEVNDTTAYLYIRVRQSDEHRTEDFRFRSMVINGVEKDGAAGDLAKVVTEQDPAVLLTPSADRILVSKTGTGSADNIFKDNTEKYVIGNGVAGDPSNWVILTLAKKTEIRRITVKLWDSNRQPRGTQIQVSEDGQVWTTLYTIEDLKVDDNTTNETGEWTLNINDDTQYSFVRLL